MLDKPDTTRTLQESPILVVVFLSFVLFVYERKQRNRNLSSIRMSTYSVILHRPSCDQGDAGYLSLGYNHGGIASDLMHNADTLSVHCVQSLPTRA